jgi:hypothetical protein
VLSLKASTKALIIRGGGTSANQCLIVLLTPVTMPGVASELTKRGLSNVIGNRTQFLCGDLHASLNGNRFAADRHSSNRIEHSGRLSTATRLGHPALATRILDHP